MAHREGNFGSNQGAENLLISSLILLSMVFALQISKWNLLPFLDWGNYWDMNALA